MRMASKHMKSRSSGKCRLELKRLTILSVWKDAQQLELLNTPMAAYNGVATGQLLGIIC